MTYAVKDKSVHDGEPIEVYKFVGPFGEYRYTSDSAPITVDGDEYEPLSIIRTSIEIGSVVSTVQTMDFIIPANNPLARLYAFITSPKELKVEVKRVHRGDDYSTEFVIEFSGEALNFSASGAWATIKTGSILQTKLNGNLSTIYYQGVCNHDLYDIRCKANRATHTTTATVTKVQGQIITVDNDDVANNVLDGGELTNTRTGEVRTIVSNLNNVVRVGYKFIDIIVGDTIELTKGCNHSRLGDCKLKFANVVNYGGFDFIPVKNPFDELNTGNIAAVLTTVNRERIRRLQGPVPASASYS